MFLAKCEMEPQMDIGGSRFSGLSGTVVIASYVQSPPRCRQNASFRSTSNNLVREVIASLLLPNFRDSHAKVVWSQGTFPALFRHGSSKTQKCCKNAIKCIKVVLSLYVSGHQHHRKSCWAQKLLYCRLNDEVAVRKVSAEQKESLKQLQLSFQAMTKNWPLQKVPCAKGPISSKTNHEIRGRPLSNAVVLPGSAFLSGLGRPLNQRNAWWLTKQGMMSVMT